MTTARKEVLVEGVEAVVHCIVRCVRRAFLCGDDQYSKINFDHRKQWVRDRLELLVKIFVIEIYAYAILSNHMHLVLHVLPSRLASLSDEEVARRWLLLYPKGTDEESPSEKEIETLAANKNRIKELRKRLGSVSWFMKSLNEYIAKMANQEEDVKGRFWESRFKCKLLINDAAVLACMVYNDLNWVRAKIAAKPEESLYTSAYDRLSARVAREKSHAALNILRHPEKTLHPSDECAEAVADVAKVKEALKQELGRRNCDKWLAQVFSRPGKDKGVFSLTLDQYLELVDWTGRNEGGDKKGAIPSNLKPILERLQIEVNEWIGTTTNLENKFYRIIGTADQILSHAKEVGKSWFKGLAAGRRFFLDVVQQVPEKA